ncbi:DUF805 domain-containing protein [Roseitranquillus sediminis]|uniref:DUF805 domain-containing protein n=1 Tax=Roseitranquillus sediminis TaxID=2809051 RepID=UPI001D0C1158|nr:DUF805 domain-containing protein [Roseitranquillus sediminis]MBM9593345.1 DUF805 domain-containing protein [Roseitranquillus sediminis]
MGFQDAVRTCLNKYATFTGRAARPEFWWFALFVFLGNFVFGLVDGLIFSGRTQLFAPIFSLAMLLPALAVSVRRLHDSDHAGWWVLLHLIPVIGFLVMLYFYLLKGDGGTNRYGPPPPR